jgi:hypothetical protein
VLVVEQSCGGELPEPAGRRRGLYLRVPGTARCTCWISARRAARAYAGSQDAALALGALTAGLAIAAQWGEVGPATEVASDDWLTVGLSGAAMVLAAVAGHGAGAPVELAAAVPPLTYFCVRAAARSITRARPSSLLRDGGNLAANAGMISMLLTML